MADTTVSNPIIPQTPPSPGSIDTRYQMTPQEMSGGTAGQTAYNARVSQYYTKPTDGTQPSTTPSTAPPVPATSSTPTVSTAPVAVSSNRTITGPDNQQYTIAPDGQIVGAPTGSTYQAGTNVSQYQDLNDIYQGAVTGKTPNQIQAERQLADYQTKANTALDQLTSIQNGTMPLTQGENAQIAGLQQQFQQMIDQQTKINQGAIGAAQIGGYRTGAAIYDQSFANSMGAIATAGVNKITDLNVKMASAIASMTNSFRTNDFNMAKSAYDEYNNAVKDRQAYIQKIVDDSQKAIEKAQADKIAAEKVQYDTVTKPIQDLATKAAANGASPDIVAKINAAQNVNDAIAAAGDSLQTATGQLGDYLQYKKDASTNNQQIMDYTTWKAKDDARQTQLKASEAYGTAFATAKGKAAGEQAAGVNSNGTPLLSPVTNNGITYQVPVGVAPFIKFASNGVKYVDVSKLSPSEAAKVKTLAYNGGTNSIPVIDNTNNANDVQNISDALAKVDTIDKAFSSLVATNAVARNLYQSGTNTLSQFLQTDPNKAALGVFNDASLDILKAISGVQGFRGNQTAIQNVQDSLPKLTDTLDTVKQKVANIKKLIQDRENALVGKPDTGTQSIIDEKQAQDSVSKFYTSQNTDNQSKIDKMISDGVPYADIMKAFNIQ